MLNERSRPAYRKWRADRRARLALRKAQELEGFAPDRVARLPAERRAGDCSRDRYGAIIQNQSFDCDVNILKESLNTLFGSSG